MKFSFNRYLLFLMVSGCCLSCRKDQNDVTPDIYFRNLKDGSVIWNSVNIEIGLAHPETLSTLVILANGKEIFNLTQAPFQATWNTLGTEDGEYELKGISTNKEGEQQEAQIRIFIRNTLLVFDAPANQLKAAEAERGWVFLSSPKGELIALTEFKNGEKLKLVNPTYNGNSFILSEAYLSYDRSLSIYSFEDVPRGGWTLGIMEANQPIVGSLSVSFEDSVGVHPYYISTTGDSKLYYEGGNSIQLKLTQSPTRLFMREIDRDVNKYNLVHGLTFDQDYNGLFANLTTPLQSMVTPALAGAELAAVRLYGFASASSFEEYYSLGFFSLKHDMIRIEYPGNAFPAYGSESFFRGNNIRVNAFHPTNMYDLAPLTAQVIFKDRGSSGVTLATFGKFDTYFLGWAYADSVSGFSWLLTGGGGQSQYLKPPDLPSAIRGAATVNLTSSNLEFLRVVQLADYEIATDYKSYIQYLSQHGFNAPYAFGKAWKEQTFFNDGVTGGGRKVDTEIPTIKELLQRR